MSQLLSCSEALARIHAQALTLKTEMVTVAQALGRVLAEAVHSRETVPAFANSAMDGFAVRAEETLAASEKSPVTLTIAGLTAAGDAPSLQARGAQTAWRIMTGAPLPRDYDAVIPIEHVAVNGDQLRITAPANSGDHCRAAGEDFRTGQLVMPAGVRVQPAQITALATTGIASVRVARRPRVLFFATGNELVDDPAQPLQPGQIRNGNGPYLDAALREMGVEAINGGRVRDDADSFIQTLQTLFSQPADELPDVILTTGAVSAGDFDFVPQVVRALGGEIIFHKLAIKPGKPVLFARLPNGVFFFGLPGNPISTAVGLRFFVQPLLARLQGTSDEPLLRAALSGALKKPRADFRHFLKAQVFVDGDGLLRVRAHSGQESHKIAPLLASNAWLILDEGHTQFSEGQWLQVATLHGRGLQFG